MEKRIFTLILVVVLGVVLGVGVVSKQMKDPMLRELLKQQAQMIEAQQRIENKLDGAAAPMPGYADAGASAQLQMKVQMLEQRLAALETQLKNVQAGGGVQAQLPPGPPPEDFTTVYDIPVDHTPVIGKKNAPVTIVEFMDFQCPFCARFHGPVDEVVKANPDKVNYMIKNYPLAFHPQAKPAAKAAFAAGEQGKYVEMARALLENNQNLNEETFTKIAKDLGLNVDKFLKDYKDKDAQWEKYIQADIELGNNIQVRGTPTFFLNGRKTNARDVAGWNNEIEQALKEKK